ncbi:MAG: inosine/xanthosine triphosphatase [Candidatus Methanodesulfokora sp.]|jgi:inosine/xanthosine triphosphatase
MRVVVGSTNPVKISAVEESFSLAFGSVEVKGIEVDSGVGPEPIEEEAVEGAINRAVKAMKLLPSDFSVGIEGGLFHLHGRYYLAGFVAIMRSDGLISTGTSGWFECPKKLLGRLLRGEELGSIMDEITGRRDVKKKEGAIGYFTKGIVDRKELYKHGVLMALARFISGDSWPG